jgi:hypothetical protein
VLIDPREYQPVEHAAVGSRVPSQPQSWRAGTL